MCFACYIPQGSDSHPRRDIHMSAFVPLICTCISRIEFNQQYAGTSVLISHAHLVTGVCIYPKLEIKAFQYAGVRLSNMAKNGYFAGGEKEGNIVGVIRHGMGSVDGLLLERRCVAFGISRPFLPVFYR